jgi:hypothetical protein
MLVGNRVGKRQLERSRARCEDNIKLDLGDRELVRIGHGTASGSCSGFAVIGVEP